jgi:ATP-dependent exoDNAse (exonuclease V) alpha subunit
MAIYHFSMKTFSRSKGQTATASMAYRSGTKIDCEREGRTHDYTKKSGVEHSEIFLPPNSPEWASDRTALWNNVEKAEKRKNSTVAREFEVALPQELTKEQRIALVADFARQIVERHGCAVDACLHDDKRSQTPNHHAHIMLTTRKLEQTGFTDKTRELDDRKSGEVEFWREQWAKTVNDHLKQHEIRDKNDHLIHVDHRSLKDQGIDRQPTIKMGVKASAMERKGKKTEKGDYNRAIKSYNPQEITSIFEKILKQATEMYNKIRFINRRLPEVKRDIEEKQPDLFKQLDEMGIQTAPPPPTAKQQEVIDYMKREAEKALIEKPHAKEQIDQHLEKVISRIMEFSDDELPKPPTEAEQEVKQVESVITKSKNEDKGR